MINRKTKQIREANLILEKRYLNEQVAATPPSATTSPVVTTTTTVTKMSETDLKSLRDCSGFNSEGYTKTEEGNYYIFTSPTPPKEQGAKPSRCKKSKNPN
jgi:hypothetical protein